MSHYAGQKNINEKTFLAVAFLVHFLIIANTFARKKETEHFRNESNAKVMSCKSPCPSPTPKKVFPTSQLLC